MRTNRNFQHDETTQTLGKIITDAFNAEWLFTWVQDDKHGSTEMVVQLNGRVFELRLMELDD
jgi:uncharacterized protein involved in type VI secretion and phage assembly